MQTRGLRRVAKGPQFSGRRIIMGTPNHCGVAEKSKNVTSTFFNSRIASERPQVRNWGRQTSFLTRSPSNLVTPLVQIYCGLRNCTGNIPETVLSFSFRKLLKSCVSYTFSILHSYFHCCLPFEAVIRHWRNNLVKKLTNFVQPSGKSRTVLSESDCVCDCITWGWAVLTQQSNNETIALFTLFDKRLGKVRHVNPDV